MRTFVYSSLVVILAVLLSLNTMKVFTVSDIGLFVVIIGLIYGLVSAFMLSNAWERFSKIRDAVSQETHGIVTMHMYAKQLGDTQSVKQLEEAVVSYCDEVPQVDWHKISASEETHKKFRRLFDILAKAKVKSPKDVELFNVASEELRGASHARDRQMLLARTRISGVQWFLNLFLSAVLIVIVTLISTPIYGLSLAFVGVITIAIVTMLFLIHELDSMRFAEREIACEPYAQVIRLVTDGRINPDQEQWFQDKSAILPPVMPHPK